MRTHVCARTSTHSNVVVKLTGRDCHVIQTHATFDVNWDRPAPPLLKSFLAIVAFRGVRAFTRSRFTPLRKVTPCMMVHTHTHEYTYTCMRASVLARVVGGRRLYTYSPVLAEYESRDLFLPRFTILLCTKKRPREKRVEVAFIHRRKGASDYFYGRSI